MADLRKTRTIVLLAAALMGSSVPFAYAMDGERQNEEETRTRYTKLPFTGIKVEPEDRENLLPLIVSIKKEEGGDNFHALSSEEGKKMVELLINSYNSLPEDIASTKIPFIKIVGRNERALHFKEQVNDDEDHKLFRILLSDQLNEKLQFMLEKYTTAYRKHEEQQRLEELERLIEARRGQAVDVKLNATKFPTRVIRNDDGTTTVITDDNNAASYQLESRRFSVKPAQEIEIFYELDVNAGGKISVGLLNTPKNAWYGQELTLGEGHHKGILKRIVPEGEKEASLVVRNYHVETPGQSTFTLNSIKMALETQTIDVNLNPTEHTTQVTHGDNGTTTVVTDNNKLASYQLESCRFRVQENDKITIFYDIDVNLEGKMSFGLLDTLKTAWYGPEVVLGAGHHNSFVERIVPAGESETSVVLRNYHLETPGQTTFKVNRFKMALETVKDPADDLITQQDNHELMKQQAAEQAQRSEDLVQQAAGHAQAEHQRTLFEAERQRAAHIVGDETQLLLNKAQDVLEKWNRSVEHSVQRGDQKAYNKEHYDVRIKDHDLAKAAWNDPSNALVNRAVNEPVLYAKLWSKAERFPTMNNNISLKERLQAAKLQQIKQSLGL